MKSSDLLQSSFSYSSDAILVRLEDLHSGDQHWVNDVRKSILPDGIVYGVLKTGSDMRPVLVKADQQYPIVIRFTHPDLSSTQDLRDIVEGLHRALRGLCVKFNSPNFLSSVGMFEEQLYCLRSFFPCTLGQILTRYEQIEFRDIISVLIEIAGELGKWHGQGFFHAHLTSENIFVNSNGTVSFMDPMIGGATCIGLNKLKGGILSDRERAGEYRRRNDNRNDFAPEILSGQVGKESDLFGFGGIINQLLSYAIESVSGNEGYINLSNSLSQLAGALLKPNLKDRLKIDELEHKLRRISEETKKLSENKDINQRAGLKDSAKSDARDNKAVSQTDPKQNLNSKGHISKDATSKNPASVEDSFRNTKTQDKASPTKNAQHSDGQPNNIQSNSAQQGYTHDNNTYKGRVVNVGMSRNKRPDPAEEAVQKRQNAQAKKHSVTTSLSKGSNNKEPDWLKQRKADGVKHKDARIIDKQSNLSNFSDSWSSEELLTERNVVDKRELRNTDQGIASTQDSYSSPDMSTETSHNLETHDVEDRLTDASVETKPELPTEEADLEPGLVRVHKLKSNHRRIKSKDSRNSLDELNKTETKKTWLTRAMILAVILLIVVVWRTYDPSDDPTTQYTREELVDMWASQIRSRAEKVFRIALTPNNPMSEEAQRLIFESILQNKKLSIPINMEMVKIAMDPRWENSLSQQDRLIVLYSSLQTSQDVSNLNPPEISGQLHPAVILGITATLPGKKALLSQFPIEVLTSLPPPTGEAFKALMAMNPKASCGDKDARLLADIAVYGPNSADMIFEFLSEDVERKLHVLAQLFLEDEKRSSDFLHTILNHPNQRLTVESAVWANKRRLLAANMSNTDKLRILIGLLPTGSADVKVLASLFDHPRPGIREYAISRSINEIRFGHPASVSILSILRKQPALLNASQTILLAQVLQNPNEGREKVKKWLNSEPPESMLSEMLVATSREKNWSTVDREISIYLREHKWIPTKEQLAYLVFHPEPLTRLYSYGQIYLLEDKNLALKFLTQARKIETEEDFKPVLDLNIAQLTKATKMANPK